MSQMGQDIIEGLKEAIEWAKGNKALKVTRVSVPDVKIFDSTEVKELRQSLGFTQVRFANVLGVSCRTIEEWERGKNKPCGSSSRLLEIIQKEPEVLQRIGIV